MRLSDSSDWLRWSAIALILLVAIAAASYSHMQHLRSSKARPNLQTNHRVANKTGADRAGTNNIETTKTQQQGARPDNGESTGSIKPSEKEIVFSQVSLYCGEGQRISWKFGDVQLVESTSDFQVDTCRIGSVICENSTVVGIGMASSKGTDDTERNRALERGINLASALKKNALESCKTAVSVSAYVLNLGRYNDMAEPEPDNPGERKVIALIGISSDDTDEAVTAGLEKYVEGRPEFANYTACDLYRLDDQNEPSLVQTQHQICSDQRSGTASLR